jgi:hypothetical protein
MPVLSTNASQPFRHTAAQPHKPRGPGLGLEAAQPIKNREAVTSVSSLRHEPRRSGKRATTLVSKSHDAEYATRVHMRRHVHILTSDTVLLVTYGTLCAKSLRRGCGTAHGTRPLTSSGRPPPLRPVRTDAQCLQRLSPQRPPLLPAERAATTHPQTKAARRHTRAVRPEAP